MSGCLFLVDDVVRSDDGDAEGDDVSAGEMLTFNDLVKSFGLGDIAGFGLIVGLATGFVIQHVKKFRISTYLRTATF